MLSDTLICSSRATAGRMGKSYSLGLLDSPDDEEYEYMNKQTAVSLRHNPHWLRSNKRRTYSLSSQATAYCDTTLSLEVGGRQKTSQKTPHPAQRGSKEVQYEYMDIRCNEKVESPSEHVLPAPPILPRMRGDATERQENEYLESDDYQYTNRQTAQQQLVADNKEPSSDNSEADEYEDMDCFAAPPPAVDTVVYQNMRREGEVAVDCTEMHSSALYPHVRVRAGVGIGEPTSAERSFDNPGYWHSKMFLKSNAMPT